MPFEFSSQHWRYTNQNRRKPKSRLFPSSLQQRDIMQSICRQLLARTLTKTASSVSLPLDRRPPLVLRTRRCVSVVRPVACLPSLKTGEYRITVTVRKDGPEVQLEKGDVVCKVAVPADRCSICQQEVTGTTILSMVREQDDPYYEDIWFDLCKPCVLAMFQQLSKAEETAEAAITQADIDLETFAMTHVLSKRTGLPMIIFISVKNADHCCRLKVSQNYTSKVRLSEWFFMTVEDEPRIIGDTGDIKLKDIQLTRDFIRLNKKVIVDFWEQDECIDPAEMIDSLQRLE